MRQPVLTATSTSQAKRREKGNKPAIVAAEAYGTRSAFPIAEEFGVMEASGMSDRTHLWLRLAALAVIAAAAFLPRANATDGRKPLASDVAVMTDVAAVTTTSAATSANAGAAAITAITAAPRPAAAIVQASVASR